MAYIGETLSEITPLLGQYRGKVSRNAMKELSGKALADYKQRLVLKPEQRHLIVGTILGDGFLRFPGRSHQANLTIDHGGVQKEYVWWKYERLKDWVLTPPRQLSRVYHKDRTRTLVSWRFSTISHLALTFCYKLFYRDGKKVIPMNIGDLVTHPLTLAVWLMDDGSKNQDVLFLSTQNFSTQEQEHLCRCLWKNFGIESTLNFHSISNGARLYRVRLTREGSKKAWQMVMPYIIPSLQYKFSAIPL